jgi:predicted ATPase
MSWPDFAQEQTTAAQASLPELVATAAAPEIHHNIPLQPTPFIGRTAEKAAHHDFLNNPDSRLITVLGPGGMGKTRLTLAASEPYLTAPTLPSSPLFPDGLFFVDLAPLTDPTQIIPALAKALQFPLQDAKGDERTPQEQVLDFLHEKQSLLILDNCEHLINGTAQLAAMILQSCSEITILASSREAFGMPGEIQFEVPPLSFPDVQPPPSFEECGQYDALHLFVHRPTAVLPAFQVTQENFAAVVEICQRLDGIPLAVELAAARVNVLTTAQIAVRLDDRFCLLSRGSRTALPRQQTLRATIDWSWSLLTDSEKLLLGRLSLFAGGMDLEAVEAVCSGDGLDMYHLLDLVSALANKSLIIARREQGQETRYRLLDTIRQYARERLKKTGQSVIYRNQHLNYFLHLGEEAEQALVGSDQVAWMKRMERELDNVRAALSWARETDVEAGLQLISALWRFWLHTYVSEGTTYTVLTVPGRR